MGGVEETDPAVHGLATFPQQQALDGVSFVDFLVADCKAIDAVEVEQDILKSAEVVSPCTVSPCTVAPAPMEDNRTTRATIDAAPRAPHFLRIDITYSKSSRQAAGSVKPPAAPGAEGAWEG